MHTSAGTGHPKSEARDAAHIQPQAALAARYTLTRLAYTPLPAPPEAQLCAPGMQLRARHSTRCLHARRPTRRSLAGRRRGLPTTAPACGPHRLGLAALKECTLPLSTPAVGSIAILMSAGRAAPKAMRQAVASCAALAAA